MFQVSADPVIGPPIGYTGFFEIPPPAGYNPLVTTPFPEETIPKETTTSAVPEI